MNPDEVVMHVVKRNRRDVILDFLRERIGQPSESAHLHSHREVLALDVAGADVFSGRTTANRSLRRTRADSGAVTALGVARLRIVFDQLPIVDVALESTANSREVGAMGIRRELNAICETAL